LQYNEHWVLNIDIKFINVETEAGLELAEGG
jgi:outer membrane protein W